MICATVEIRDDGSVSEYFDMRDRLRPSNEVCDSKEIVGTIERFSDGVISPYLYMQNMLTLKLRQPHTDAEPTEHITSAQRISEIRDDEAMRSCLRSELNARRSLKVKVVQKLGLFFANSGLSGISGFGRTRESALQDVRQALWDSLLDSHRDQHPSYSQLSSIVRDWGESPSDILLRIEESN